ncbi:MAG: hypothetical protein J6Q82_00310 [Clostridia bacterium]|nr:hypothetical protein [Clostridia bacterium]
MAINNFIPTVWSENLYQALDKKYIAVANCNREFEGDITSKGSVVKICGVGDITIGNYTKNSDMSSPQILSDTVRELTIDRAKYFNFQIDDVDRAQAMPHLMDAAMKVAADSLANEADKYIYDLCLSTTPQIKTEVNESSLMSTLLKGRQKLWEIGASDFSDVVLEITPSIATLLMQAEIKFDTNNSDTIRNGCLGKFAGMEVFVSNNLSTERDGLYLMSKCIMRTKRAVAFAEQLSEVEAYRPEKRFADAVKGLHLYGAEIVYPNELVILDLSVMSPVNE